MVQRPTKPRHQSPGATNAQYESFLPLWKRARAVMNGEHAVKQSDRRIDRANFSNLLIPFSPFMSDQQYAFYKAEAELPGLVSQYGKVLSGGLLRRRPVLELPDEVPEEAMQWLTDDFTVNGQSIISFLDEALWEEIVSSRAWVFVDYPSVPNAEDLSSEERAKIRPYPVLWRAEDVINWQTKLSPTTGQEILSRVVIRYFEEEYEDADAFSPELVEYAIDHSLDENNSYRVRYFKRKDDQTVEVAGSDIRRSYNFSGEDMPASWVLTRTVYPQIHGEPLRKIPAFPLNGSIRPREPVLMPLIDREVSLYNKMAHRNHLLYTASTFTPVFMTSISDESFGAIVEQGLGTYIRLNPEDSVDSLKAPTEALDGLELSIGSSVGEMARMGIRLLAPDGAGTSDSGIALEIRNSAQTSQLSTLNIKISQTMRDIICLMLEWKYELDLDPSEIGFTLSADFNPAPMGEAWMRMISDWYDSGKIPRSLWLEMAKQNDVIPIDYDDDEGVAEIASDPTRIAEPPTTIDPDAFPRR